MPLPEFLAPDSETTILFIRPNCIIYFGANDDPIFPADTKVTADGGVLLWGNSLPRSSILGCADVAEIRNPETGNIWNPKAMDWNFLHSGDWDPEQKNMLLLLVLSLWQSNTFNAVTSRPGSRFDAQSKLVGSLSQTLSREQWKVEVRKIFETSLARLQGNVLDIARGVGKDLPYARNLLIKENMSLCHIVKLQSVGWRNISLFWLIILPTMAFLLWVLTIEMGDPDDNQQQTSQVGTLAANPPEHTIVLTWLIMDVCIPVAPRIWTVLAYIAINICPPIFLKTWKFLALAATWIKTEIVTPVWQKVRTMEWRDIMKAVFSIIKSVFQGINSLFQGISSLFKGVRSGFYFRRSRVRLSQSDSSA